MTAKKEKEQSARAAKRARDELMAHLHSQDPYFKDKNNRKRGDEKKKRKEVWLLGQLAISILYRLLHRRHPILRLR